MAYPRLPNAKAALAKAKGDIEAALAFMMSEATSSLSAHFLEQIQSTKLRNEIAGENNRRRVAAKKAMECRKEGRFDRRKFALSLYKQGKSLSYIGKILGVQPERARQIVFKAMRESSLTQDQIEKLIVDHGAAARGIGRK